MQINDFFKITGVCAGFVILGLIFGVYIGYEIAKPERITTIAKDTTITVIHHVVESLSVPINNIIVTKKVKQSLIVKLDTIKLVKVDSIKVQDSTKKQDDSVICYNSNKTTSTGTIINVGLCGSGLPNPPPLDLRFDITVKEHVDSLKTVTIVQKVPIKMPDKPIVRFFRAAGLLALGACIGVTGMVVFENVK
jgi:hypothetical protein